MVDDDAEDCAGTKVSDIGTFTTNDRSRGTIEVNEADFDIAGTEGYIGAYLQLNNSSGDEVACCEILEKQSFWREGGTRR